MPVISSWSVHVERVWRKSTTHSDSFWSDSVNSSSTSWRAERVMYSRLRLATLCDLDASSRLNELVAVPSAAVLVNGRGAAPVEPLAVEPPIPWAGAGEEGDEGPGAGLVREAKLNFDLGLSLALRAETCFSSSDICYTRISSETGFAHPPAGRCTESASLWWKGQVAVFKTAALLS